MFACGQRVSPVRFGRKHEASPRLIETFNARHAQRSFAVRLLRMRRGSFRIRCRSEHRAGRGVRGADVRGPRRAQPIGAQCHRRVGNIPGHPRRPASAIQRQRRVRRC